MTNFVGAEVRFCTSRADVYICENFEGQNDINPKPLKLIIKENV